MPRYFCGGRTEEQPEQLQSVKVSSSCSGWSERSTAAWIESVMAVHVGNGTSGMLVNILDSTLVELCVGLRQPQLLHCKTSSE